MNLSKENEIVLNLEEKYHLLMTEFKTVYNKNETVMPRLLHYAINKLRTKYDMLTESYIFNPNDSLSSVQDFDDYYLGFRDQIEYVFHAIKILDQEADFLWLSRIKKRIESVDNELLIILPDIYHNFKKLGVKYIWEPEKSLKFWWRKLEYDVLNEQ